MPESGTSGSAGGALGRFMVTSTRARRWKRRTQPRGSLRVAPQRPIPTADRGQPSAPIYSSALRWQDGAVTRPVREGDPTGRWQPADAALFDLRSQSDATLSISSSSPLV